MKQLIIFDINGVLCFVKHKNEKTVPKDDGSIDSLTNQTSKLEISKGELEEIYKPEKPVIPISPSELITVTHNKVYLRPGLKEFLSFCYDNFDVGFFSSTSQKNANPILNIILNADQHRRTVFRWFRDRTKLDPDFGKAGIEKHETIKLLKDVWECPSINEERLYNETNTILLDDSASKTRFNNKGNVILVKHYYGERDDRVLLDVQKRLTIHLAKY